MTKKEEAPGPGRFLFSVCSSQNKKAGRARPFHPFFVSASTSVVKAFNGLMFQGASIFMGAAFHHQDRLLRLIFG